jgi:hypothetical protein
VLLLRWHLGSDRLEPGQWFKGRIYERRCDLSPSGDLLIYFAAKHRGPLPSWTAISKPPYLTALALWPKGDAWGGGGVFDSELSVLLNHRPGEEKLADGFRLKKRMRVSPYGAYPGRGEDFPIYHSILLRNGWSLLDEGECGEPNWRAKVAWTYTRPMVYEKTTRDGRRLQMLIKGVSQKNDPWYWIDFAVLDQSGTQLLSLPRTDWADWHGEDLLLAKNGKLFRLSKRNFGRYPNDGHEALKLVADVSALKFEERVAPRKAAAW